MKAKILSLLLATTLSSCEIPLTPSVGGPEKKVIKEGSEGDGFDLLKNPIWKGSEMNLKIKLESNCWYPNHSSYYGEKPLLKVGGWGEAGFFYYHANQSARVGMAPSKTSKDSVFVGSFVHDGKSFFPFYTYAFTVKTGDWFSVRILMEDGKYKYTFNYKGKTKYIEEKQGKSFVGYKLGFHEASNNKAPQQMEAIIIYSGKEFL